MLTRITKFVHRYITRCERVPQRGLSGGRKPRKSSNTWGGLLPQPPGTVTEYRDQYGLLRLAVA